MTTKQTICVTLAALFALAGCQIDSTVTLELRRDLTGSVRVEVELDAKTAKRVTDTGVLEFSDLEQRGWSVETTTSDGGLSVLAVAEFDDPDQMAVLLADVGGSPPIFTGWTAQETESFASSSVSLNGVIDLSGGLERFGDDQLGELFGGLRAGVQPELSDADQVTLAFELDTDDIEWDTASPASVLDEPLVFNLGDDSLALQEIDLLGTTRDPAPSLLIVGGGVSVLLAGLIVMLGRRTKPDSVDH